MTAFGKPTVDLRTRSDTLEVPRANVVFGLGADTSANYSDGRNVRRVGFGRQSFLRYPTMSAFEERRCGMNQTDQRQLWAVHDESD